MKKMALMCAFFMSVVSCGTCFSAEFCEGASFVRLGELLHAKKEYLNARVKTHAIIKSDGKEYALLQAREGSDDAIMMESDLEVIDYRKRNSLPSRDPNDFIGDYLKRVDSKKAIHGLDMTKISSYRQERVFCGRIIEKGGSYYFAVDDSIFEKAYFIGD
ncbi:hypothetical protein [Rhodanobacter sp. Root561]|uniref:hypothetical protein n=1 Tax=Rhodanobacter sp. Root561 TaxID=1736560 RepID=UPI000AA1BDC1|nr:hypothetical protein [Rhodanobacter sp. Root561]